MWQLEAASFLLIHAHTCDLNWAEHVSIKHQDGGGTRSYRHEYDYHSAMYIYTNYTLHTTTAAIRDIRLTRSILL